MQFEVKKTLPDSLARTGALSLPHGVVQTPVFMPVGTQGIVKTLAPWEMEELGAEIILGNTYHLHLRPGEELINKMGGLNEWSQWPRPILTDSGGYQAYSLGETRGSTATLPQGQGDPEQRRGAKTTDEGVSFASHLDGQKLHFTPENVLDIQAKLGSDIAMVLDDCPPIEATKERVESAIMRTSDWAKRSIDHWQQEGMALRPFNKFKVALSGVEERQAQGKALFGIVQGGIHDDLRQQSLRDIQALPFDGIAVGGVAIESEGKDKINLAVASVAHDLDKTRPHYLMGVGEPEDLIRMVHLGIDMFDCVIPTRFARHGSFWIKDGFKRLTITTSAFTADSSPLDPDCNCRICQTFSRSYLRHLFMTSEMFALRALSYHNLHFILRLMEEIRAAIEDRTFTAKYREYLVV